MFALAFPIIMSHGNWGMRSTATDSTARSKWVLKKILRTSCGNTLCAGMELASQGPSRGQLAQDIETLANFKALIVCTSCMTSLYFNNPRCAFKTLDRRCFWPLCNLRRSRATVMRRRREFSVPRSAYASNEGAVENRWFSSNCAKVATG